ncbi:MAG: tetratricopeptide repeat protein [Candidatus Omnitrophota bacterium]
MKKVKLIITACIMCVTVSLNVFSITNEDERFYVATKAFSDNFYDASISLFERFIQDFPQSGHNHEARLYIAKCYYFKENYPRVIEMLNELAAARGARSLQDEIFYWLAELYFKGKNYKDAQTYARKLITSYPDSKFLWWGYYLLASSNVELKEINASIDLFEKIIDESPEREVVEKSYAQLLEIYFQKTDYFQLAAFTTKYLTDFPRGAIGAQAYYYLAESYTSQNKIDKAVEYYRTGLDATNDKYLLDLLHRGMGFAFLAQGDTAEAKKQIDAIAGEELRIFSQGTYSFKIKDYAAALEKFNIFLKSFPQSEFSANAHLNRAATFYEIGRINDSIAEYRYLLDSLKTSSYADLLDKAHYGLAWGYLKNGEFKKAITEFEQTLKYTDNPIVKLSSQIQIADAYQESGDHAKALQLYNDILKTTPKNVYSDYIQFQIGMVFLKTGKLEDALLALRNMQKNFPRSRLLPEVQYYLALSYFSMERYQDTQMLIEDFMDKYPQSEFTQKASYLYGKTYYNLKDYNAAIDIFTETMKQEKNKELQELAFIDIGNAYLNLNMFTKAKQTWEEFLNKFPRSSHASSIAVQIGGLYEREENYLEAEKYYKKALESGSDSTWVKEAQLSLAHLYWRNNDLDRASDIFKKVSDGDTPLAQKAKLYLAKIYAQQNNSTTALAIYDELAQGQEPIAKAALLEKAFLLRETGDYAGAVNLFQKIIKSGVDSAKIRFSLALCLEKMNRIDEALNEFLTLVYSFEEKDYTVKAFFHIARIYEKKNDIMAARDVYKKVIALNVDESTVARARLKELESRR